jgi:hypothetical protein
MVIKPTLRQSAQKMFSVYQELHVGSWNLVNTVTRLISDDYEGDVEALRATEPSRTRIMKAALGDMLYHGSDWFPEGSGYDSVYDDAEVFVKELFPDFY